MMKEKVGHGCLLDFYWKIAIKIGRQKSRPIIVAGKTSFLTFSLFSYSPSRKNGFQIERIS